MPLIEVNQLVKVFTIVKKEQGLRGALAALVRPRREQVRAVDGIRFSIERGEIVGYIGPNGAGKSTTIKILTGILHPTSGTVRIAGLSPQDNRQAVVQNLGVVFGQRTQLYWDLRLGESFELLRRIYRIPDEAYVRNLREMSELLEVDKLMDIPVRQLSLGQRMRGDLAAAMLHSPSILFLDEPTIGLDVVAKDAVREFILNINRLRQVTVILTTHDLDDVEQLCQRLIVINHGKIVADGPLDRLLRKLTPYRQLVVDFETPPGDLASLPAEVIQREGPRIWLRFDRERISAAELIAQISSRYPIRDLSLKEPKIEDAIKKIYSESGNAP